jgi:hypothetical protein
LGMSFTEKPLKALLALNMVSLLWSSPPAGG